MNNLSEQHTYLVKQLSHPFSGDTPVLDSKLGSIYVNLLPEHTDGIWEEKFSHWPALVAQLWLLKACDHIAEASNILRKQTYTSDPVVDLCIEYPHWLRKLQPFWTNPFVDWLQACKFDNDLMNIIKPVDKLSNIVRGLLFGDEGKQKRNLIKLTHITVADMFLTNRQHHRISLDLARRLHNTRTLSEVEESGYAHVFLAWGMRGLEPTENFTQRERDWWALGFHHEKNEDTDPGLPNTKDRLHRLQAEPVVLRAHLFKELLTLTPTDDLVHPSVHSEMRRWVINAGNKGTPTFFDSARALFPEKHIELTNMQSLDFSLGEAIALLTEQAGHATANPIYVPEDLTP